MDPAENRPPEAELEILACLWQHGQATARQIREIIGAYRPMSHGAAVTLLKRLEDKGMVAKEKGPVGKAFVYRATNSPRPTYRRILRDLTQRIFGGNSLEMVSTFFDAKPPTPKELDQLQTMLDKMRKDAGQAGQ
ncbi:MAG: BlaI/MecI/CopY family transcriptional regulator [Phycisphaerae bacterium]|nr:BlaI/MecI/CopY family transcriptional regulator [Phycisphaerae bacterium]